MTVLWIGEWKKQLLVTIFHPHTRLKAGPLRETVRDFVAVNHCSPM